MCSASPCGSPCGYWGRVGIEEYREEQAGVRRPDDVEMVCCAMRGRRSSSAYAYCLRVEGMVGRYPV